MSDPISVAGTVAGLVSLAIQLSQVSYWYVASIKGLGPGITHPWVPINPPTLFVGTQQPMGNSMGTHITHGFLPTHPYLAGTHGFYPPMGYSWAYKGSSEAWSSYIQELSALTSVLLRLQTASEVQERSTVLASRAPNADKGAIDECVRELQQLKSKLDAKLAQKGHGLRGKLHVDALVWPFSESDTQKKVDMLHRYHGIFSSALLADNL
jgi:hypothetical protein